MNGWTTLLYYHSENVYFSLFRFSKDVPGTQSIQEGTQKEELREGGRERDGSKERTLNMFFKNVNMLHIKNNLNFIQRSLFYLNAYIFRMDPGPRNIFLQNILLITLFNCLGTICILVYLRSFRYFSEGIVKLFYLFGSSEWCLILST